MSRARCVPLQYQLNASPGVKVRLQDDSLTEPETNDFAVPLHLLQRDDSIKSTSQQRTTCEAMYTTTPSIMDCERYQDLSELGLFARGASPRWAAAEAPNDSTMKLDDLSRNGSATQSYLSLGYEGIGYNLDDMSNQFYSIKRTDSLEEMKNLVVTAPMEVVPMRHHEALQVSGIVKTEREDMDLGREEEVIEDVDTVIKEDPDLDSDLLNTPDLLSELQGCDLVDYILRDSHGQCTPVSEPLSTPPHMLLTPPRPLMTSLTTTTPIPNHRMNSPPRTLSLPTRSLPSDLFSSPTKKSESKPLRETYLAIPREITAGIGDDKKIPKMLILKTPDSSHFQDMAMSIAERIKTVGKRQRSRKFSETQDEDDDDDEDYVDKPARKRSRRISTSSSCTSAGGLDRYRELRDKNNEASRKSRQNRKEREKDLQTTLDETEQENMRLRAKSDELEKLVDSLRKLLLQIVVSKGTQR